MNTTRLLGYLDHIQMAASDACSFIELIDKEEHAEFVERHAEFPWRNMRGMRNRIAHGYFDINLDVVWNTVRIALPELLRQLAAIRDAARKEYGNGAKL